MSKIARSFFPLPTFVVVLVGAVLCGPRIASAGIASDVDTQLIATLSDQVVHIANSGVAGDDRLFLVRKRGIVEIYDGASVLGTPFLDIDSLVHTPTGTGDERGLLSIAFHPDYGTNGLFYVNYINNSGDTVIEEYDTSGDPNVADTSTPLTIIEIAQTASNHNGGQLQFGPTDDYLYIGMGDGGGGCDSSGTGCNAQKTDSLLGAMLRIDVDADDFPADATRNYAIPLTNPFVLDGDVEDEIWSYGLRNPWRFSFDRLTGDMYIGDVGQSGLSRREEVNMQTAGVGGQNYGWPIAEGTQCDPGTCGTGACPTPLPSCASFVDPLYEYTAGGSCAVTGGFVYRGSAIPSLVGRYVFGDYCNGDVIALDLGTLDDPIIADTGFELTSFGEDIDGELYAAVGDDVYRFISTTPAPTPTPAPVATCPAAPDVGCRTAAKGILKINDRTDDTKDLLLWKWIGGAATTQTEMGADPVNGTTSYAICLYDQSASVPSLSVDLQIARGGDVCGSKPCFKALGGDPPSGKGWKYKDTARSADGVLKLIMRAGDAGKSKIILKAKGAAIPLTGAVSGSMYFEQDSEVLVQLVSSDGGACFETTLSMPATKNVVEQFKDKL